MEIMQWVELFFLSMRAVHLKGDLNQKADRLSSHKVNNSKWCLNQEVFELIIQLFSLPSTDLFANHMTLKILKYFCREVDPRSMGTDALSHRWPQSFL